jgi:hypothetical protein
MHPVNHAIYTGKSMAFPEGIRSMPLIVSPGEAQTGTKDSPSTGMTLSATCALATVTSTITTGGSRATRLRVKWPD